MSQSVYLFNTNFPSDKDSKDILMMEWAYELPLLLQPLLISESFIENVGLYYDAKPGIENLKRFYTFLESIPSLIHNKNNFIVAKNKLFDYLDGVKYAWLGLEAPGSQAAIWQADIAFNNAMITGAMDKNDISLLSYHQLKHVSMAFQSFAEVLNFPDYNYGWAYIHEPGEEIYKEQGLWGLKSAAGEILLPAQFDEFYEFSRQGIAVVMKDQQYGYVHRTGEVIVLPEWEEAYDFDDADLAIVQRNGRLGLINTSGKIVAAPCYETLNRFKGNYIAQKNGAWGILAADGTVVTDFKYDKIEVLQEDVILLQKDGVYSLTEEGDEFDLIVRKATPQGFAWAFKGKEVYLIDKYGISRANKALVQQDIESYEGTVRERLLAYAQSPDGEMITDAYTPVEELYNMGVDAYNRQDYTSAIDHYTLAAEKGYGYAMNNLAFIYYMVDGYVDGDKAFYWYEKGAAAGNTNAINGWSLCFQNGVGTAPDIDKAIDLLQQAAADGMAAAHNNLGFLLYERDPEQALYHYLQAAALGEPDYFWLGFLYAEKGEFETAIQYLKMAIAGGDDAAHIELARIYQFEEGFIDKALAAQHITAAEKAGLEIPDDLTK